MTEAAWWRIRHLVMPVRGDRGGRPCCEHRWREYVNALLFIVTTGIPWRSLPHDFTVTWSATHKHFTKWTNTRLWEQMLAGLRAEDRVHAGRDKAPTAAVVDSSSVKSTPVPGPRGFDGAKKIDGIKRHILVDTAG
ncbi:MAG: transposase [Cellulosimicrobium cellulans]|nr:transposase [Cellulosimicrobium cellulans]